jgi:3-hydroxyacyl-[acyl-carrier-protein] dehydratase
MKLINDFYTIQDTQNVHGKWICKVALNPRHKIFEVHFPDHPITPGACVVQMASELLELYDDKTYQLKTAIKIRFKKPILPTDTPVFVFSEMERGDGLLKTRVCVEDDTGQYARMLLLFNVI